MPHAATGEDFLYKLIKGAPSARQRRAEPAQGSG
jgi:hypothetical protein